MHVNKTEPTYVTNEYVTRPLEREILREVVIRDNNIDTSHFITRSDYDAQVNALLTSVEGSSSGASNALSELSDSLATSFTTDALTVSGSGSLSILSVGTTSAYDILTLDGMAYLAPVSAPTTTTNRLYNYDDNLYWSGNPIVGTLVGSWTSDGTHAWRPTGNVGIGTTTPGYALTVAGDTNQTGALRFAGNAGTTGQILLSNGSSAPTWTATSSLGLGASFFEQNGNSFGTTATLGTNDANNLVFETNNTTRVTIDTSGNVGIGTTSPAGTLEVWGNAAAGTTRGDFLVDTANKTVYVGRLSGTSSDNSTFVVRNRLNSDILRVDPNVANNLTTVTGALTVTRNVNLATITGNVGIGTTSPASKLTIGTGNAGFDDGYGAVWGSTSIKGYSAASVLAFNTNGSEAMRIINNGNVGIGTTTPTQKLVVQGSGDTRMYVTDGAQIGGWVVGAAGTADVALGSISNDNFGFLTNGAERMRITTSGNVGIGTTTPATTLHITNTLGSTDPVQIDVAGNGGIKLSRTGVVNPGNAYLQVGTLGDLTMKADRNLSLVTGATTALYVQNTTGNVGIGTTSPAALLHLYDNLSDTPSIVLDSGQGAGNGGAMIWRRHNVTKINQYLDSSDNWRMQVGGSDRVTVNTSGNVGIGTTSPTSALTVQTTSGAATSLLLANTSTGTTGYTQMGFQGTGRRYQLGVGNAGETTYGVADKFYLFDSTGGAMRMVVDTSGNVGIGTSSPDTTRFLTVERSSGTNTGVAIFRSTLTNAAADVVIVDADNAASRAALQIQGNGGSTEVAFFGSNGNVGIGTTTPSHKLQVTGSIRFATDGTGGGLLGLNGSGVNLFSLTRQSNDLSITSFNAIGFAANKTSGPSTSYDMVIDNGNVGIGTTSPSEKLHVVTSGYLGGITLSGSNTIGTSLLLDSTATGGRDYALFSTANGSSAGGGLFSIYDQTATQHRLVVNSTGNVGIGTTTPEAKLSVAVDGTLGGIAQFMVQGSTNPNKQLLFGFDTTSDFGYLQAVTQNIAYRNLVLNPNGGNVGIGTTSPTSKLSITQSAQTAAGGFRIATSDNADFRAMYMDSAGVFSFYGGDSAGTLNTATLNAAGEWTNASDRAYKERIEDLFYGLDAVMLLQPRSYVMRGTNQERIGFIAQEVELVLPELVSGEEGKKGISYGNMAAVIVKAIQDLYTFVLSQFKAQEQNNEEQEASIEALESRIRELEARQGISSPLEEAEEPDVDNSGVNTPIDLCLNLDGDQTELPTGFVINEESGECLEGEPTDEEAEPVDVTPVPILGCTDEEALNYDIAALEDDGSCDYEVVETTPEITAE